MRFIYAILGHVQYRSLSVLALLIFLSACSSLQKPSETWPQSQNSTESCNAFFNYLQYETDLHQVHDVQTSRVDGYPYLRTNRFLSSLDKQLKKSQLSTWIKRMQTLATKAMYIEYQNLPRASSSKVRSLTKHSSVYQGSVKKTIQYCADHLSKQQQGTSEFKDLERKNMVVKDHYQTWKRVVGLYALTAPAVALGIHQWHKDSTQTFTENKMRKKSGATIVRYAVATVQTNTAKTTDAGPGYQTDALGIPDFSPGLLDQWFTKHAPIWEIETESDNDRIGAPSITHRKATASVDINKVVMYRKLSYTHYFGEILPQLNYFIWFPARPCVGVVDILCGHMDGMIWRVTLSRDGKPLLYDAVHQCGCYHLFFPTAALKEKPPADDLDEDAFSPRPAPSWRTNSRLVVRMSAVNHHIIDLYRQTPKQAFKVKPTRIAIRNYDELRSLETQQDRISLFDNTGLIPGTERLERWLFWPMGILSPGAMRQWGTHATAFVGRRHFDDPCLIEQNYISVQNPGYESTYC